MSKIRNVGQSNVRNFQNLCILTSMAVRTSVLRSRQ